MSQVETRDAPDPLIEEVRSVRRALSEQTGNDVDRLCERLREIEKENASRVVTPERSRE